MKSAVLLLISEKQLKMLFLDWQDMAGSIPSVCAALRSQEHLLYSSVLMVHQRSGEKQEEEASTFEKLRAVVKSN